MKSIDGNIALSATDLVGHLNCRHLTELDLETVRGARSVPHRNDPFLEILQERGDRHEAAFVEHLEVQGLSPVVIPGRGIDEAAVTATLEAMRSGAEVITQAALTKGAWRGRIDVLRRVEVPSDLGAWSYEPIDTKLARETKGGTIIQLCLYAELVEAAQGLMPEHIHVVAP